MIDKSEAYKRVYDDLMQVSLFRGIYDASHGKEHFMYGVSCVMEFVASGVNEETHEKFEYEFTQNMIESEERAENRVKGVDCGWGEVSNVEENDSRNS